MKDNISAIEIMRRKSQEFEHTSNKGRYGPRGKDDEGKEDEHVTTLLPPKLHLECVKEDGRCLIYI
jgi:hypothetical protein